ncbi:MAG TPA: serine/threonine-protein kinase [Actinomycetes bacterium]|nr:serine/threonine-protein kinase [Actinomycetes bacterium]
MSVAAGTRLADRYVLLDRIGGGGMGAVWRASDTVLDRPVAIKVLAAQLSDDAEFRQRFRREARAAARLDHPSITQVYDYGEIEQPDGVVQFLVMELLHGTTLASRLEHGPLPSTEVAGIGAQVADALDSAHRSGVVHRDVTPGNIMLTPTRVKVLDFGISTVVGDASMTVAGQTLGTPAYLAPERVQGLPATAAVDVYALGAVLYNAITGHTPFQGTWTQQAHAHVHQPVPDLDLIPEPLGRALAACLSKWPAERPTAAQLAEALHRIGNIPQAAPPVPVPMVAAPVYQSGATRVLPAARPQALTAPRRRGPGTTAMIALALFLAGAIAMFSIYGLLDGGQAGAPPADPTTTASTPSTRSESPSPDATQGGTAQELLNQITELVTTATVNGDISPRVAIDIGRSLGDVVDRVGQREYRKATEEIEDLNHRLEERFQDGDVAPSVYFQLTDSLDQLVALIPDEDSEND